MPDKTIAAFSADYPDLQKHQRTAQYIEVTECPSCHYAIEPKPLSAYYVINSLPTCETYRLHLLSLCKHCRHVFVSEYQGGYRDSMGHLHFSYPPASVPSTPRTTAISDDIKAMSPNFAETYAQAEIAEAQRLHQICGVGYRKALEFLVKDYLCHKFPDAMDAICAEPLGTSLRRIEDHRIKALAERSTWIGNDETHYVRKHEDLDVNDMKRFIKALLIYVESELAFEEALGIERK